VAVETVVGDVELAADEPLRERRLPVEDALEAVIQCSRPAISRRSLGSSTTTGRGVVAPRGRHVRVAAELGRRREDALLAEHGIDGRLALRSVMNSLEVCIGGVA